MTEEKAGTTGESKINGEGGLSSKLTALGWGLFFIWIGLMLLLDMGTGIGLLGVGIITLGIQVARKFYDLKLEVFWVVIGILFTVSGLWELFEADLPLVPIVLIVAGIALLISTLRGRRSGGKCCCENTKDDSAGSGGTER